MATPPTRKMGPEQKEVWQLPVFTKLEKILMDLHVYLRGLSADERDELERHAHIDRMQGLLEHIIDEVDALEADIERRKGLTLH